MKRNRVAAMVATLAIATTGMVGLLASTAGAQSFEADAELIGITENTWRITLVEVTCPGDDPVIQSATSGGAPVDFTQTLESPTSVIATLPADATAGQALFVVSCETTPSQVTTTIDFYASLAVTKVVDGPVPDDATFTVNVACDGQEIIESATTGYGDDVDAAQDPGPFAPDLAYDAAGGTAYVYTDGPRACTITEPNAGGATATTIDVPDDLFDAPLNYDATVTNVFALVVEPSFTG